MNWLVFVCLLGWIYILTVLYRAKLNFWYYICGSVGLFIFSLILIEPYVVVPLQKAVSAVAGVIGGLTHLYDSIFSRGFCLSRMAEPVCPYILILSVPV